MNAPQPPPDPSTRPDPTPPPPRSAFVSFEGIEDAGSPPDPTNPECTGSIETCDRDCGECMVCGARDCPNGEPLHYHHDGCPACTPPDQRLPDPFDLGEEDRTCRFCGAGPFMADTGPDGWDAHWADCELNPRHTDVDRMMRGFPYKFPLRAVDRVLRDVADGVEPSKGALEVLRQTSKKYRAFIALRAQSPLQAVLHCPVCGTRHVDEGEWATRRHHTHRCVSCRYEWRVEPYCVGIPGDAEEMPEEDAQAIALALAVLSLQYPGWSEFLGDVAVRLSIHLPYLQFRLSKRGEVAEAADSPLVQRVEALEGLLSYIGGRFVMNTPADSTIPTKEQVDEAADRHATRLHEAEDRVEMWTQKATAAMQVLWVLARSVPGTAADRYEGRPDMLGKIVADHLDKLERDLRAVSTEAANDEECREVEGEISAGRIQALEAEVSRLKDKCARYSEYAEHSPDCKSYSRYVEAEFECSGEPCSCGLAEVIGDVNPTLVIDGETT